MRPYRRGGGVGLVWRACAKLATHRADVSAVVALLDDDVDSPPLPLLISVACCGGGAMASSSSLSVRSMKSPLVALAAVAAAAGAGGAGALSSRRALDVQRGVSSPVDGTNTTT